MKWMVLVCCLVLAGCGGVRSPFTEEQDAWGGEFVENESLEERAKERAGRPRAPYDTNPMVTELMDDEGVEERVREQVEGVFGLFPEAEFEGMEMTAENVMVSGVVPEGMREELAVALQDALPRYRVEARLRVAGD